MNLNFAYYDVWITVRVHLSSRVRSPPSVSACVMPKFAVDLGALVDAAVPVKFRGNFFFKKSREIFLAFNELSIISQYWQVSWPPIRSYHPHQLDRVVLIFLYNVVKVMFSLVPNSIISGRAID
jgi:hypothetical protein